MVQKFSRKELQRLGCTEEDVQLILKCQKELPVLFDNDNIAEYSVNAIDLWNQIGSKDKFSNWIKSNVFNSENVSEDSYQIFYCTIKKWENNPCTHLIDYEKIAENEAVGLNQSQLSAKGISKSCMLKLDTAEDITMYIGALPRTNKATKEISRMYRKYFRILKDIVIKNKEWFATRDPEKVEYKKMSKEIDAWCYRIWGHHASHSEYAVEADMLNVIVSGKTSQQLKSEYGVATNELIRDYLKKEHNEELLFFEEQNQVLLLMDMGFTERKNMLTKMHQVKFRTNESLGKTA